MLISDVLGELLAVYPEVCNVTSELNYSKQREATLLMSNCGLRRRKRLDLLLYLLIGQRAIISSIWMFLPVFHTMLLRQRQVECFHRLFDILLLASSGNRACTICSRRLPSQRVSRLTSFRTSDRGLNVEASPFSSDFFSRDILMDFGKSPLASIYSMEIQFICTVTHNFTQVVDPRWQLLQKIYSRSL